MNETTPPSPAHTPLCGGRQELPMQSRAAGKTLLSRTASSANPDGRTNQSTSKSCGGLGRILSWFGSVFSGEQALDLLDAPSDLLGTVGSIGETLDEEECARLIEVWVESKTCSKSDPSVSP